MYYPRVHGTLLDSIVLYFLTLLCLVQDVGRVYAYEITVSYNNNGAISLLYRHMMWSGGAHVYTTLTGYTYTIGSSELLEYTDILNGSENYIDKLLLNLSKEKISWNIDAESSEAYVLTEEGLCFYYNVGDAVSRVPVTIPFTESNTYIIDVAENFPVLNKTSEKEDLSQYLGMDIHDFVGLFGFDYIEMNESSKDGIFVMADFQTDSIIRINLFNKKFIRLTIFNSICVYFIFGGTGAAITTSVPKFWVCAGATVSAAGQPTFSTAV